MDGVYETLCHALGLDANGRGESYRSHFVTGEGSSDYAHCMTAVAAGLMVRHAGSELTGGDYLFRVTDAGRKFVADNRPELPRMTAAQRRYRQWLDADSGLSFGEWIKREARACNA